MKTAISKKWTFDAAHRLPNHQGKCAQPHGHTYTVTVRVEGEVEPIDGRSSEGMVLDFDALEGAWQAIKPRLDHRDLNDLVSDGTVPITTSEHLAAFLLEHFQKFIEETYGQVRVALVRVSETPSTYAEVRP